MAFTASPSEKQKEQEGIAIENGVSMSPVPNSLGPEDNTNVEAGCSPPLKSDSFIAARRVENEEKLLAPPCEDSEDYNHHRDADDCDSALVVEEQLSMGQARVSDMVSVKPKRKPGNRGDTALHTGCFMGNVKVCEVLVQAKADLNASSNSDGGTPLMRSIEGGHLQCAELLVNSGANLMALDKW